MEDIEDFVKLYIQDSDMLREFTEDVATNLENNIKSEAPYKQGRLKRSIRVDTRLYRDYSLITGYWDEGLAPHGIFVLAGTKPHDIVITPKTKKALFWEGAKYPVKKSVVHHPGTEPNDFLGRGLQKTLELYR